MKVLSTYKILKEKALNEDISGAWIDWAIEMIEAGYESENLYILAGVSEPFNQFELQELTSKVLQDLQLEYSYKQSPIKNYAYYLITNSADHPETYIETLRELKDIYYDLGTDSEYKSFYLLYFAKVNLSEDDVQWYWDGANQENIDQIIQQQFRQWLNGHNEEQPITTA